MSISKKISGKLKSSSWIRKMFEEGLRMKKEHGADNVFDLSLGNPVIEPPEKVLQAIKLAANDTNQGCTGTCLMQVYMMCVRRSHGH